MVNPPGAAALQDQGGEAVMHDRQVTLDKIAAQGNI